MHLLHPILWLIHTCVKRTRARPGRPRQRLWILSVQRRSGFPARTTTAPSATTECTVLPRLYSSSVRTAAMRCTRSALGSGSVPLRATERTSLVSGAVRHGCYLTRVRRGAGAGVPGARRAEGGYLNLGDVGGTSPVRDTTTCTLFTCETSPKIMEADLSFPDYHGPRRGQRYYGYQQYAD